MREVVCWSGGMDSTHIVFDLLKKHDKITLIHFNNERLSTYEQDKKSRAFFLDHFKKYYPYKINYLEYNVECFNDFQLPNLAAFLGLCVLEDSNIHLGYIRGDDFWHFKTEFESVFYNLQKMNHCESKLVYDLEWKSKEKIIKWAKSINIFDRCTITKYVEAPQD